MNTRQANVRLKSIVSEWADTYRRTVERSRQEFVATAQGGETIPAAGRLCGKAAYTAFEDQCAAYREEAQNIIEESLQQLREKMVEAPSADAVHAVELLALRADITKDEVELLLEKYGGNVQAYKAIASVASKNGIRGYVSPLETRAQDMETLQAAFRRSISAASAENGHASPGFCDMLQMQVDQAFPVEE